MAIYIKGMGCISPQNTWGNEPLLANTVDHSGDRMNCVEPDYSHFVDVKQLRRMSRIIKMGVAAGMTALRDAGLSSPDGIITGTSFGCLEDTGVFLSKMIENKENALNPTPFIQSTHNTIGSQIALLLQCQGYNQTYTQRAFSFEHALIDAILELKENPNQSILTGGVDEITGFSHTLQSRFGIFRSGSRNSLDLFTAKGEGTLNGEGAVYFVLSGKNSKNTKVCIDSATTIYKPDKDTLSVGIERFLDEASLKRNDIDLLLLGRSGDYSNDIRTNEIVSSLFTSVQQGNFKHLCGEYPTASAFALWLGAKMIQDGVVPDVVSPGFSTKPLRNVLIYNPYFGLYHSLILLKAC